MAEDATSGAQRVAAIIVTHNRYEVLRETLAAVAAQTEQPARVIVVDSASNDETPARLAKDYQSVECLALDDNVGPAGGFARGIALASSSGADWFWMLDDDSQPEPSALASLLSAAAERPHAVAIGMRGGLVRHGRIRHTDSPSEVRGMKAVAPSVYSADFVMNDGALVSRRLVEEVGLPRADLFIMMEDVEYTLRASRLGLEVCVLAHDAMRRQHLGASGEGGHDGTWRDYYQTRNHVRIALESGDVELIVGCFARQVHLAFAALRAPDRRFARLQLRLRGVVDGVRGRMGRTLEPGSAR